VEDPGFGGGMRYELFYVGEAGVGGITGMPPGVPDEAPAHWQTVFAVADCDAAVAAAQEHGGAVLMPPTDMEGVGRFAVVCDPQGAQFGLIRNA
jgi:predicted enzyme related to lactoylglutathione lyase